MQRGATTVSRWERIAGSKPRTRVASRGIRKNPGSHRIVPDAQGNFPLILTPPGKPNFGGETFGRLIFVAYIQAPTDLCLMQCLCGTQETRTLEELEDPIQSEVDACRECRRHTPLTRYGRKRKAS